MQYGYYPVSTNVVYNVVDNKKKEINDNILQDYDICNSDCCLHILSEDNTTIHAKYIFSNQINKVIENFIMLNYEYKLVHLKQRDFYKESKKHKLEPSYHYKWFTKKGFYNNFIEYKVFNDDVKSIECIKVYLPAIVIKYALAFYKKDSDIYDFQVFKTCIQNVTATEAILMLCISEHFGYYTYSLDLADIIIYNIKARKNTMYKRLLEYANAAKTYFNFTFYYLFKRLIYENLYETPNIREIDTVFVYSYDYDVDLYCLKLLSIHDIPVDINHVKLLAKYYKFTEEPTLNVILNKIGYRDIGLVNNFIKAVRIVTKNDTIGITDYNLVLS